MTFVRSYLALILTALALCTTAQAAAKAKNKSDAAPAKDEGSYRGYIVVDAANGNTLLEENADVSSPPASMTKLMTFLLVHEAVKAGTLTLESPVEITKEDSSIGGTQVYLDPREHFTVDELLYALMIQSANDAASALSHAVAGTREVFVEKMNAKARELGMTRTSFITPHGLSATGKKARNNLDATICDLTSPRDFSLLCRELIKKTDILKYTAVKERSFPSDGHRAFGNTVVMRNHNNLLKTVSGVDGLKTGYTEGAGYCLSATAQRQGQRVIVVIMGAYGRGGQIDKGVFRDRKAIELLGRGFAALPALPASPISSTEAAAPVSAPAPLITAPEAPANTGDAPAIKFSTPPRAPAPKSAPKNNR